MTKPSYNQCLLFIKPVTRNTRHSAIQPIIKGFVLLPSSFRRKCPEICKLFFQNGLHVADITHNFPYRKNDKVEFIEVFLKRDVANHLVVYVSKYHEEVVRQLFSANFSVKFVSKFVTKSYRSASDEKGLNLIKQLLTYRAVITYSHKNAGDLLHFATKRGDETLVKFLIESGSNVNAQRNDGSTPLHIAAKKELLKLLQLLIENGANTNSKMLNGATPLHVAVYKGHRQTVEYLLQNGANVDSIITCGTGQGSTSLHISIKGGHRDIAQLLLKNGANVNAECSNGISCLQLALETGDLEMVLCVLEYNPNVNNKSNKKGFFNAIWKPRLRFSKVLEKMFQVGFAINQEDASITGALCAAVGLGKVDIVQNLLEHGAQVNEVMRFQYSNFTPLHLAASRAEECILKLLLDFGAEINGKSDNNITPLRMAVINQNVMNVQLLLENGANILNDHHIAYEATKTNKLDILVIILDYGGDPNSKDPSFDVSSELTPLAFAVNKGFLGMINALLKYGACIEYQTDHAESTTVIFDAIYASHLEVLQILLDFEFSGSVFNSKSKFIPMLDYLNLKIRISEQISDRCEYNKIETLRKALQDHLLRMKAANVTMKLEPFSFSNKVKVSQFLSECKAEIINLQNEKVGVSNVTFYDILTFNVDQNARLVRNDSIAKTLMLNDYKRKFPIYAGIISWQFKRGFHRKNLLEQGVKVCRPDSNNVCQSVSNKLKILPYEVLETILDYLSDRELLIFIKSLNAKTPPVQLSF